MSNRSLRLALLVLAALTPLVASSFSPVAEATVRGEVSMVGEKPVTGTYNLAHRNYSEDFCGEGSSAPYICFVAYRVSRGTAQVKLRTYKLQEGMTAYDYYIVDVEVANAGAYGKSDNGWLKVHIDNVAGSAHFVDYSDTKSISSTKEDCYSTTPSFGVSLGPAGADFTLGSITFCDDGASYDIDYRDGTRTVWMAHDLRDIQNLVSERIVKVDRGQRPKFEVKVHVPTDDCTDTRNDGTECTAYVNDTTIYTYTIGTTG